jgi:predicted lipid-binding transport protein (Tim44 family)
MPSSLVFAALVLAWLVILVPMVARRRREVVRTADSALAARVLHRGGHVRSEEVPMPEPTGDDQTPRRYRPGRGGFDPEAAELAARARYSFRQRVVLGLLLTALVTGLFAAFALPMLWSVHAFVDLILFGYLAYLRRQVRIEQEIRQRRAIRAARARRSLAAHPPAPATPLGPIAPPPPRPAAPEAPAAPRARQRPAHPNAAIVELDDEDPAFCDLEAEPQPGYRRAAGQ